MSSRKIVSHSSLELVRLFGKFLSVEMSDEELEVLVASRLPRSKWQGSAQAYKTKWYDYRFMSPARCLTLYAHYYIESYRKFSQIYNIGVHSEVNDKTLTAWSYDTRTWTGFLKGMQMADGLGIPYDFYINEALRDAFDVPAHIKERYHKPIKRNIAPQSYQLYAERRAGVVLDIWDKKQAEQKMLAKHPYYNVNNFAETPIQCDYLDYLKDMVNEARNASLMLYNLIFKIKQLSEQYALENFNERDVKGARALTLG